MPRLLRFVMVGFVAGTFLWGAGMPPAHAVFGIRAARKVIAARRAEKAMRSSSEDPDGQVKASQDADRNLRKPDHLERDPSSA